MGLSVPERLLAALSGTVASGESEPVTLGTVSAFRVKRLGSSVGVLRWTASNGGADADEGFQLTEDDPDSGWIPADAETELLVYADGGDVTHEVMRLQRWRRGPLSRP